jgi:ribosomal protein S18 acetylase RimI-like enzyme
VRIRPATVEDADALAVVHVLSWQAAYVGQVPQEHLDALDPATRRDRWADILRTIQPPTATTVLEHDHEGVIGFVSIGPGQDDDADPTRGELMAIYVAPAYWGLGAGRRLMDEALRQLRAAGFASATLWVLASNSRAREFYEAFGWRPDGTTTTDHSRGFPLDEVRYHVPLPGAL